MLLRKSDSLGPSIPSSEITPKEVFEQHQQSRRRFLAGAAALGAGAIAATRIPGLFHPARSPCRDPASDRSQQIHRSRRADALQQGHQLQQLLRVRHRQIRSRAPRPHARHPSLDGEDRRPRQKAPDPRHRLASCAIARSRAASTAIAASKPGRWSFPGTATRSPNSSTSASRCPAPNTSSSPRCSTGSRCPTFPAASTGPTPKACAWTRP